MTDNAVAYVFRALLALHDAGYPMQRNAVEGTAERYTLAQLQRQGIPAADAAMRLVYDRATYDDQH
jgi:hypothetical protein